MAITAFTTSPPSSDGSLSPTATRGAVSKKDVLTSLLGRGPIPRSMLASVLALVREQHRIGARRAPETRTQREGYEETRGAASGERVLAKGERDLSKLTEAADGLAARRANLLAAAERRDHDHVVGPQGQLLTVGEATARHQELQDSITADVDRGSLLHRRVDPRLRRWALRVALIDYPVLFYFLGSVFNVDFSNLMSTPFELVMTGVFALFGTAGVALALRMFGKSLRAHKDEHGHLRLPKGGRVIPIVQLCLFGALLAGAGWIMAYRIVSDSAASGLPPTLAWTLGAFFAVITVAVNLVVLSVEYHDGSILSEQADHLTAQLLPVRTRQQAERGQADQLAQQIRLLQRAGERLSRRVTTAAGDGLGAAHQILLLARSYHGGCGPETINTYPNGSHHRPSGYLHPALPVDTHALEFTAQQLRHDEQD
ncbi:hypothetical protein GCM10022403_033690 [Streptomyces coacervatus]|uniref:Uncharacterized protein n=1 Tax=Streptomyces coacervatus TaxID=647381 RepID=A0ABP7HJU5_9ACTN|nr:hypothetical protein [Streptomyces coacervatus]MDF2272147.1 hypothetical protein [Streptomyces coacervatus]